MKSLQLRQRQIHLDFHTSPAIPGVGADFDAREFARTMKRAHVNSVTVFAKCHHGHLYYNTKRAERHPSLPKGLDLLRKQVDALHHEGIRAPIYISIQCDQYAATTHPEWVCVNPDKTYVTWAKDVFGAGWQILDMSTPYQEFLAEQTEESLRAFQPVDGVFFDMCWDQQSVSRWALAGMECAGLNPEVEADRIKYSHQVALAYMDRFFKMVRRTSRDATVFFNGRQHSNTHEEHPWQTQVEIEALPTGGWGYLYFPKNVRQARNYGKPTMGMTARFHKSWADFGGLKPHAALKYEVSQMLAHGAACSIGDQLHPRGTLDKAAYELIGSVYGYAAQCEPWTKNNTPVVQIGLFREGTVHHDAAGSAIDGATRVLMQLKQQFDIINAQDDFSRFDLLVLADEVKVDAPLAKRLRAFVKRGGKLLITGQPPAELLKDCGIKLLGESLYTTTYIRLAGTNHVMYERGWRVKPTGGAKTISQVVEPYFERTYRHFCSHAQTPYRPKPSAYAAAVHKGSIVTIPYPIFKAYATHGNLPYRTLVQNCLDLLLPEKLTEVTAPSSTEVTVMQQGQRTIVHFLQFVAERRTPTLDIIEDVVPLVDVALSVRLARAPKRVYLAPQKLALDWEYEQGRAKVKIPRVDGHAMIVFEGATP